MKILFVHQNFPGQFVHLAPALVAEGHEVFALLLSSKSVENWEGVRIFNYTVSQGTTVGVHPWAEDFETKVIRAEGCLNKARELDRLSIKPDVILAHHGWGESMFLKDLWPKAKLALYCEYYYQEDGADVGFDPEFQPADVLLDKIRLKLKNINNKLQFENADAGISPTKWQASTFPEPFKSKITVIHDGIKTKLLKPDCNIVANVNGPHGAVKIQNGDEIITFVSRNLEPYRGYHIFMRALPELLQRRPNARVLIVGNDSVSYGAAPEKYKYKETTWKQIFANEVKDNISKKDWERVHFLGQIPYDRFIALLQLSSCHIYLTYPFVLSWSLMEAMSVGCRIVASDTQPLHEVIDNGHTGLLVNFFDQSAIVNACERLLDDKLLGEKLGKNAREFAKKNYDLETKCLPEQIAWINRLVR